MSTLRQSNGDDHPEAARKHLDDASVLASKDRPDGTSYLAGYVVECCLKSLILFETGMQASTPPNWRGRDGHDLRKLATQASSICAIAGARVARYLSAAVRLLPTAAIMAWDPEMRYHAPAMTVQDAAAWLGDAQSVYRATVEQMFLDGVI